MADNDIVIELIKYFNNKDKPHRVRLYKNVPISHIRMGNPHRNYTWSPNDYKIFFKSIPKDRIPLLTSNIKNAAINNNASVFKDEFVFLDSVDYNNLTENEILAIQKITHLARSLVFINDLDENEKFRDPIVVGILDDNRLSIHPGRLRVNALEYLFLKNKKEYYVDVIYYKSKKVEYDITYDSFLIDKECIHINSLTDFSRAYGYENHIELIKDSLKGNCHIYVDSFGQYYLNKYISYTKEDFINGVTTVEKMIIES
jgi:hypothetical protein